MIHDIYIYIHKLILHYNYKEMVTMKIILKVVLHPQLVY